MKLKKGDKVIVLQGKDKGVVGDILSVLPEENKVIVKGVAIKTRNKKSTTKGEQGKQIKEENPIDVSNIAFYDESKKAPTRIKIERKDGKRIRVAVKSNKVLES